jgi:hypothetical protein
MEIGIVQKSNLITTHSQLPMVDSIDRMSDESGFGVHGEARDNFSGSNDWNGRISQQELESLRFQADQGNADGQWRHSVCLRDGIGISKEVKSATHYLKLSADQGNADGQWLYGECLRDGTGISQDLP